MQQAPHGVGVVRGRVAVVDLDKQAAVAAVADVRAAQGRAGAAGSGSELGGLE